MNSEPARLRHSRLNESFGLAGGPETLNFALGSVPRSINDPVNTNDVNIGGFLNMLVAARDAKVKRFVYAASSSTYGDSEVLPKVEDVIGRPLSPYAHYHAQCFR